MQKKNPHNKILTVSFIVKHIISKTHQANHRNLKLQTKSIKLLKLNALQCKHDVCLFTFKVDMMLNYRKCSAFIAYIKWAHYQIATILYFSVSFFHSLQVLLSFESMLFDFFFHCVQPKQNKTKENLN